MRRYPLYILCLAALTACAVGPDYVKPRAVTELPASFKEMGGWKMTVPQDDRLQEKWWQRYHDPQLNDFEERLTVSSQTIRQAEAQYRQASALVRSARAGYYPGASLGASATRSRRSANAPGSSQSVSSGPVSDFQLPLSLAWEIDLWGRVRRTVEASEATAAASADDLAGIRLSMQAALAADYFQLRVLDTQKGVLDETVANYQKFLELTRNRYQSGVAAKSDLLQAQTQLKNAAAQAIDLGLQRAQLEHAIAVLLGVPASEFSLASNPITKPPPAVPMIIPSELLEKRPDIAAAERRMAAANAQIGVAKAAYFPILTLSAAGGGESSSIANWLAWPSRFWSVGPAVSENLFDGGLRRSQSEQAQAAYDATVAAYRQTVLTAFQDVEDNLAALRILEAEARVQDEADLAAVQTTAVIANQYQAGIVGYLNVISAQTTELANRKLSLSILERRLVASVQLIKALGGGWQKEHEQ